MVWAVLVVVVEAVLGMAGLIVVVLLWLLLLVFFLVVEVALIVEMHVVIVVVIMVSWCHASSDGVRRWRCLARHSS